MLYTHAGAEPVAYEALREVPLPPATATYQPIPHHGLLDAVKREVEHSGLTIERTQIALGGNRSTGCPTDRMFALLDIANGAGHCLVIGVRNSHDKVFPAGLACGSHVFVCDNLAFSGEITLARKHTVWIERDLPRLVNEAIGRLGDMAQRQAVRIDAYQHREITDERAHDAIVRMIDAKVFAPSKLEKVLAQWRKPEHAAFAPRNVWSLFNGVTEVLKGYQLMDLPRRTTRLHGVCDMLAGVGGEIIEATAVPA